jgi:hypothetical protein
LFIIGIVNGTFEIYLKLKVVVAIVVAADVVVAVADARFQNDGPKILINC